MKGWNLFQLMHRKARGDEVTMTSLAARITVLNPTVTQRTADAVCLLGRPDGSFGVL